MRKIRRRIYVGDDGCLKRFSIKCLCKVFKNCLSSFLLIDNARFIMMMVFANLVRIYSTFLFFIVSVQEFFLMRFDVSTRIMFRRLLSLVGISGLFLSLVFGRGVHDFFIISFPMGMSLNEIAAVFWFMLLALLQMIGLILWFCDGEFVVKINPFSNKLTIHLRRNKRISQFKLVSELRRALPVWLGAGVSHLHIETHLLGRYDDKKLMQIGERFLNGFGDAFQIKVGRKNDVWVRMGHRMLISIGIKPASEFDGYIQFSRK